MKLSGSLSGRIYEVNKNWRYLSLSSGAKQRELDPTREGNPDQHLQASETDQGLGRFKEAHIYCRKLIHSSPRSIFPMIAVWDPIFCRFRLYLHMMSLAIGLRSREREGCYPQIQKNQGF